MPATTTQGITYPVSTDTVHTTDDLETLALSIDAELSADRTLRDAVFGTYTPVITGSTSGTWIASTTTIRGKFRRSGRHCTVWGQLDLGGSVSISGSITGTMQISLPVNTIASHVEHIGTGLLIENSPLARWVTVCETVGSGDILMVRADNGATVGNNTPAGNVWQSGDSIRWRVDYETSSLP